MVPKQQVATVFCSRVFRLAGGHCVSMRKWLLQTTYIHSKSILGWPLSEVSLHNIKSQPKKRGVPLVKFMGIQACTFGGTTGASQMNSLICATYSPDLWLPSYGLVQTCLLMFCLFSLCHWDNNPRPYHVSQCLEGLTVILLPLTLLIILHRREVSKVKRGIQWKLDRRMIQDNGKDADTERKLKLLQK